MAWPCKAASSAVRPVVLFIENNELNRWDRANDKHRNSSMQRGSANLDCNLQLAAVANATATECAQLSSVQLSSTQLSLAWAKSNPIYWFISYFTLTMSRGRGEGEWREGSRRGTAANGGRVTAHTASGAASVQSLDLGLCLCLISLPAM